MFCRALYLPLPLQGGWRQPAPFEAGGAAAVVEPIAAPRVARALEAAAGVAGAATGLAERSKCPKAAICPCCDEGSGCGGADCLLQVLAARPQ